MIIWRRRVAHWQTVFDGAMKQMVVSFLDQKDLTLKTWMNCRVSWTKSAGNEAIMMFLEQFLIGNLWNACLICAMLGLKWLLRNRLSLTFPVSQLVCPAWFLFLSLLPSGIWPRYDPRKSVGQQAFAISMLSSNTAVTATGTGWLQDTTELIASPETFFHFAFVVLIIWLAGVLVPTGVYWGRKLAASYSQAICNGPIPSNPQAV